MPLAAVLGGALLLTAAARIGPGQAQEPEAADPDPRARGAAVFQRTCAACHGQDAGGRAGTDIDAGPPIDEVDLSYIDLVLRTGRMPIAERELGVRTERLTPADRAAVVAWMQDRFDLVGAIPEPTSGDAGRGLAPFVQHCAACHGASGDGGVAGGGTFVPALRGLDPVVIFEAVRVGPFDMPAFSDELVPEETLADIVAYLAEADTAPRTLLGLREVDEVATGAAVLVLLAAALGVVHLVADRPDGGEGGDGGDDGTTPGGRGHA